jgi:hypothetical protein
MRIWIIFGGEKCGIVNWLPMGGRGGIDGF